MLESFLEKVVAQGSFVVVDVAVVGQEFGRESSKHL